MSEDVEMTAQLVSSDLGFLNGDDEIAALMRQHDWTNSPLGTPDTWPHALRLVVSLMLSSRFPMFVAWGPKLGFLYNEAYVPILGMKHPQALGTPFEDVWPEIWPDISPLVDAAMAGRATYQQDLPLIMRRRGYDERAWFTFSYSPVHDDEGRVAGMYCACTETTKQVLAERALSESEARFRNMADHAPMMMWVTDPSGYCTYLNRAWFEFTGQSPSAAEGFGWLDPIHPDDRAEAERVFRQANEARTAFRLEYRLRGADGCYRWALDAAAPRFGDDGDYLGHVGSVVDIDDRRSSEERQRQSEQSLRRLTNSLPAIVWFATPDGELHYFNDRWYEFTGQTPEAALPDGWVNTLHPDDVRPTAERWADARARGVTYEIEIRYRRHDGAYRWYVARAEPQRGEDGAITAWVGSSIDIHERKEAETALRISEAQFRVMADAVPQIVWITDAEARVEFFNRQWFAYTGAAPLPTTAGEVAESQVHPDDGEATMIAFDRARQTGTTFLVEHRIRSATGEYRWFLVRGEPWRDPDTGEIVRWYGASIDIHDRKLAEQALLALNADLERQVVERSRERGMIWRYSLDLLSVIDMETAAFDAVNPAWTTSLGWSAAEIVGQPYVQFLHPDDVDTSAAAFERVRSSSPVINLENRYRTKAGEWRWLSWMAVPEGGKLYSITRDITEEKARQAELEAAQEALRQSQKMEAMGQLTGGVAHDFNNLLTPIVGSLDMLQRRGVGGEREQRLIAGAMQSAERARTLVQRLLAFARRQPLQPVPVDVAALVAGMGELVASTAGPQIKVVVETAPDLPPAKADPNQLEMALLNLAVNARDAMPDGGTLRIAATDEAIDAGHPADLPAGRYIRLSVADTGIGMSEGTLARAVEPFFSTKGIGKGTGLGLSMVHGLASQLGGALTIRSQPALGTCVDLWLPRSSAAPEQAGARPAATQAGGGRGTVLLVDDEDLVRMSTADMLSDLGFRVTEATSAEEALALVGCATPFDVLVTDHLMPGMTGSDLAQAVRSLRPGTPVLLVSGYAEQDGVAPDLPRLAKPFRKDELADSLLPLVGG
ncbi:hybrid sensor histidine kinase/response regulator [Sphingomonas jatrophae]|uniref:histidine kinase n=1 Tax=Sphingomonas jatrophae TaxID=1166337 RepID=A0A1I6JXK0_9SPHN|nr:PAS domain-containing sensor histidine kinase [Sphingomonas jatrophae]SFR83681.1 PAS domain S-box-containing protein [Sphingomonas jatrophae]